MNRTTIIALAAMTALSACQSGKKADKPREVAEAVTKDTGSLAYKRRMAHLEYNRGGQWRRIRLSSTGDAGLVATDPKGSRLLVLRWPAGYDVYQIDPGCKPARGVVIRQGRGAARDDLPPLQTSAAPGFDLSSEIRRVCDTPPTSDDAQTTFEDAIRRLRDIGQPTGKTAMPTSLPKVTDAQRAEDAAAMETYRKAHSDWKPRAPK